jgi:hypothetical protein
MPTAAELLLEQYEEQLQNLVNANIDATTTNPSFMQNENFPGLFLEENSPVKDIYEYEKIINEESDETTNTTTTTNSAENIEDTTPSRSKTGY